MRTRYRITVAALVAVSAIGLCLFFLGRQSPQLYRATVLPSLGGDAMGAHAINERGQVVGTAQTKDGKWHFFFWDPQGGMQDLGVTGGGRFDINNACQIAGSMIDPNGNEQAFLWECDKGRTLLGTLGGKTSHAMGINNRGQIVGNADLPDGSWHAFLWDRVHGMRDLGTCADFRYLERPRINNAGQIAWAISDPNGDNYACLVDPDGSRHACHPPGGEEIHLNDLNNRGRIVGYLLGSGKPRRAFVWSETTGMRDIPLPDAAESMATGINDLGQIVGSRSAGLLGPWSVFLWDPNAGVQDLGSTGARPTHACYINNQGFIVARLEECALSVRTREEAWRRLCPAGKAGIQIEGLDEAGRFAALTNRQQLVIRELDRRTVLRSFLWAPGEGFTDISGCLELTDAVDFFFVRGINNKGQVVGSLKLRNRSYPVGVLLQPVPQHRGK